MGTGICLTIYPEYHKNRALQRPVQIWHITKGIKGLSVLAYPLLINQCVHELPIGSCPNTTIIGRVRHCKCATKIVCQ